MLKRQKALLRMIQRAGRPVGRIEAVKWAFLLREETASGGGDSFYDFLPYHYGPYSFSLYQEADKLVKNGYLEAVDGKHWAATELASSVTATIDRDIGSDADRVVERFGKTPYRKLIDYVYDRNPWYTANSRIRKDQDRPVAEPAAYTAGYQSLSIDAFLDGLMRSGIQRVIDVRANPVARRYGFHKSTMNRLCGHLGIEYVHIPELGIPSELRRDLETPEDYRRLFSEYEATVLKRETDALERVAGMLGEKAGALVCMEADPGFCHRTRIARAVAKTTGMRIKDVRPTA